MPTWVKGDDAYTIDVVEKNTDEFFNGGGGDSGGGGGSSGGGGGSSPSPYTSNPAALGTASPGSSSNYSRGDHVHPKPSASDIGAAPAVTEVTVATDGAVSQALDAGKIYHFTGNLTSLTITLTATTGLAEYAFDFESGANAPTLTITGATMPDSFAVDANKRYEVNVLNGYGLAASWAVTP